MTDRSSIQRCRLVVFGAAVLFRVALFFSGLVSPVYITPDSDEYRQLARSMLRFHVFGIDGVPKMNRTPGYPAFLALLYATGGDHQAWVTGAQIVLDALACVMAFDLALRVGLRRRFALAAGIASATCLFTAVMSFQVMTETLYSFALVASVWILPGGSLSRLAHRRNLWRLAVSGAAMGLGALVRPTEAFTVAAFLGLAVVLLALRVGLKRVLSPRVVAAGLALGLAAALTLGPWLLRNRIVFAFEFEKPVHDDVTLLGYKTDIPVYRHWYSREYTYYRKSYEEPMVQDAPYEAPTIARFVYPGEKEDVDAAFAALSAEVRASDTTPITKPTLAAFARIADKRYAAAPRLHVTALASRFLKFWISPRASIVNGKNGSTSSLAFSVFLTGYNTLYVLLGFAGLAMAYHRARATMLAAWATILAHTMFYAIWHTSPHSRYAVPMFPLLCVGIGVVAERLGARLAHFRAGGSVRAGLT